MRLEKDVRENRGFDFRITNFDDVVVVNFEQKAPIPNALLGHKFQNSSGVLRFRREGQYPDGNFSIQVIVTPWDSSDENFEKDVEDLSANSLVLKCSRGDNLAEFEILMPPKIDEEGWNFEFSRAPISSVGTLEPAMVDAERIISGVFCADELHISVQCLQQSSNAEFERTKMRGFCQKLVQVELLEMDLFRDHALDAFGVEEVTRFAARNGLRIAGD